MAEATSIPAARVPLLEPGSNIMSREWYRFLFAVFGQTGGGATAISLGDLELSPFSDAETSAALGALASDVQGLMLRPAPLVQQRPGASFANTTTQTISASTATTVIFNTTTYARGVGLASTTRVSPTGSGAFLFTFNAQLDKTAGGDSLAWIWFSKNGANLANTAMRWKVRGSDAEIGASLSAIVVMGPQDYVEAMWASDSPDVILSATVATAFSPAGPSALLTVTQVDL